MPTHTLQRHSPESWHRSTSESDIYLEHIAQYGPSPLCISHEFVGSTSKLLLKNETTNATGAFKWRGAQYAAEKALASNPCLSQLVAASAGNFGMGVARAAQQLGLTAKVFAPQNTPQKKIEGLKAFGAEVDTSCENYDCARVVAEAEAALQGDKAQLLHAFDDLDVIRGQGSIGDELVEQLRDAHNVTVYITVGGGGLFGGVAQQIKSVRPDIRVIGVQVEGSDSAAKTFLNSISNTDQFHTPDGAHFILRTPDSVTSYESNIVEATNPNPLADGVKVQRVGDNTARLINQHADGFIVVPSADLGALYAEEAAQNQALSVQLPDTDWHQYSAEPAGMLAKAGALRFARHFPAEYHTHVAILSGANYDETTINTLIEMHERLQNKSKTKVKALGTGCISAAFR